MSASSSIHVEHTETGSSLRRHVPVQNKVGLNAEVDLENNIEATRARSQSHSAAAKTKRSKQAVYDSQHFLSFGPTQRMPPFFVLSAAWTSETENTISDDPGRFESFNDLKRLSARFLDKLPPELLSCPQQSIGGALKLPVLAKDGKGNEHYKGFVLRPITLVYDDRYEKVAERERPTADCKRIHAHPYGSCRDPPPIHEAYLQAGCLDQQKIIQSQLQKAIRRHRFADPMMSGVPHLDLRSAWALMQMDVLMLLRRLRIIMIEDSKIFWQFPCLIWFMVACGTTWRPQLHQASTCPEEADRRYGSIWWLPRHLHRVYILHAVRLMAQSEQCHYVGGDKHYNFSDKEIRALPEQRQRELIWSLQIGDSYGGKAGDRSMIRAAANDWMKIFATKSNEVVPDDLNARSLQSLAMPDGWSEMFTPSLHGTEHPHVCRERRRYMRQTATFCIDPVLSKLLRPMRLEEFSPCALDFHCTNTCSLLPGLLALQEAKLNGGDDEQVDITPVEEQQQQKQNPSSVSNPVELEIVPSSQPDELERFPIQPHKQEATVTVEAQTKPPDPDDFFHGTWEALMWTCSSSVQSKTWVFSSEDKHHEWLEKRPSEQELGKMMKLWDANVDLVTETQWTVLQRKSWDECWNLNV